MTLPSAARELLERLVALPTVPGAAGATARRTAAVTVRDAFADAGLALATTEVPGDAPLLHGWREAGPDAPRVLLYAHYDVQPADPAAWASDPFAAVERDGRLYGRGAADDKGAVAVHLAVAAAAREVPVSLGVLIEGEEEVGSPGLAAALAARPELVAADVVVVLDGVHVDHAAPTLISGLRGIVKVRLEVETYPHALHDGLAGGLLPDAGSVLTTVLADLHATFSTPADADADGARGAPDLAAAWELPSLAVYAIDAGDPAAPAHALLPRASAVLGYRVPPPTPAAEALAALQARAAAAAPAGARVTVEPLALVDGWRAPSTPEAAVAAWQDAFGAEPRLAGIGGFIPVVPLLARLAPAATLLVPGVGDPSSRIHDVDESVDLRSLSRTAAALGGLLERLAAATG